jgi:serine/threonine protein kinase
MRSAPGLQAANPPPTITPFHAGTVNHLAPELFTPGTQITPAIDAWAFGIMMWEVGTGPNSQPY